MQKLPLGIQTFKKLREGNYLYVDKTEYIYRLVTEGSVYFLSRPRRFGKSLTLSTLGSLFEGEKELFKGLYIYDKEWDWKKWPVLRFDFSMFRESHEPEQLINYIENIIDTYADNYKITLEKDSYNWKFKELLKNLPDNAVILINEYDKPIKNFITDPQKARKAKNILMGIYALLKSCDSNIKFTFLTGSSLFSNDHLSGNLNHLNNLTMSRKFNGICGFSDDELDIYFGEKIETGKSQIKEWYGGYQFNSDEITYYNPASVMNYLETPICQHS